MTDHDLRCPAPQYWHSPGTAMAACQCDLIAKVRADERDKLDAGWLYYSAAAADVVQAVRLDERADLRAKVEALGHTNICSIQLRSPKYRQCTCFQKDVLALLVGSDDD